MEANIELSKDLSTHGLSANTLKLIAIVAMVIDHIAWAYVPTASLLGQIMHIIGRLTAPIMCYFVAEGYYHTKNMKKYIGRMAIFAVISHFAFVLEQTGQFPIVYRNGQIDYSSTFYTSVIYTLLLGLITLIVWNKNNWSKEMRVTVIILLCILGMFGDWYFISVLWIFFFGIYRENTKKKFIAFSIIGLLVTVTPTAFALLEGKTIWWDMLCQFGIYLSIPLLMQYNGTRGGTKNMKWLFYIFYPLHLIILGVIRFYLL
mgnify:CR=1 FL=1